MGLFTFRQELAMDLGTANTIIIKDGKIVLDEPSVVAFDVRTGEMIAVGTKAREMYEKGNANIRTIRPLRDGVIADFNAAEKMIRGMIRMISRRRSWFTPSYRMVVCIPSGSTEVEIRAVRDSSEHADGRDIYMIYEPMAAAVGVGIDVLAPEGHMIVDIGGGTTEIAVISLGGIVKDESIRTAGDEFTRDIMDHMRDVHKVKIGERTAEQIKINVGAVYMDLDNPPSDYLVRGADMMNTKPREIMVNYREICECLEKSILKIENAILKTLDETPPELYSDICINGVVLAGGGALLRGLDKRLTNRFGIEFKIAEDPLHAVAIGTGVALKNIDTFNFLIR
ncbi:MULTISPECIES: rod shape-determining protein [unclassified Porphyromonas]|uniref:rod shape-determining protein n=1 Tax=unclassified Porphyromonas TaxID=2645799 RepID=UPI00052DEF4A|nr:MULTISPECIES: rod shape-determining protein [unclassified Porphyromonas]KGN85103.1 rod shape-determining protein MreB [Porphyromonas sp. COT-290 OH860]KGO01687.1 rod shape-determining protein MreB [Porphyromonas sp. COT-290 OH3588]